MIHFLFSSIMFLALFPYILILIFPEINRLSFFWLTGLFYTLYLIGLTIFNKTKIVKLQKYKTSSYRIIIFKLVILIPILFFCWHYMNMRWKFEPYGMWDSLLMWNLKAKAISTSLLQNSSLKIFDVLWYHNDYPLTLPVLNASLAIVMGKWSEYIPYFLNFFLLFISILIFLESISKTFIITPTILLILFTVNPNYLNLASDLCADHFLSLSLLYLMFTLKDNLNNVNKAQFFQISIAFALISISTIKNEGVIYTIIAILLFIFYHSLFYRRIITSQNIKLLTLLIFICLISWIWKYFVFQKMQTIDNDFVFQGVNHFIHLIVKEEYLKYIWKSFWKFHIIEFKGILLLSLGYLVFFATNLTTKIMAIYLTILVVVLNLFFLFSKDVIWHLSTAYFRINIVLFPSILYLFVLNSKELFLFKFQNKQ